ncbi:MAG TPA: hypothetical protein VI282_12920, partial [Verrucomicrobiae bacterium]
EIRAQLDGSMQVHVEPPTRRMPAKISLKLREPGMRKIAKVNTNAAGHVQFSNETIVLLKGNRPLDLTVTFK